MNEIPPEIPKTPSPSYKRRRLWRFLRKPWVIIVLTLFVIAGVAAFSVNQIMQTLLHARAEVIVPNLEGKGLMEALEIVSHLQLSLKQDGSEFDESLPAGTILRQQPPSGMQVREGRSIRVVLSKGGQAVFVPVVIGKPLAEAQSVLATESLQLGAVTDMYSLDLDQKYVMSQDPSSGTVVARGALVDVVVSKGMPPSGAPLLPDFLGQPVKNVEDWASGVNAKVRVNEDAEAVGVSGTVVKQDPMAGQPLLEGEDVEITIVPVTASAKGYRLNYQIPSESGVLAVRIMARDNKGESEVYKGEHEGGQTIEIPIHVTATTRLRIYVNDVLKDERVVEP
ncbi:MAG: PASTA domain-containing protein [Elusimicrobia bacterium]|nr:PASTA domain-containing protein [Candidatus Obscuribacterium magneticum]MCB4756373.1 PASTA domain-containing protein [Candidatus Obscuribacterium magneticum]